MTKVARVCFSKNNTHDVRLYDYYVANELDVEKGDHVIVETPLEGYQVVKVEDVVNSETVKATKWIVDKVDLTAYNARIEREKQRKEIAGVLEKKLKAQSEIERFNALAASDPEAAELLKKLKDLT